METTIGKLKLGSKLVLGAYTAGNGVPSQIVWLKASLTNDFITERVVDWLCFDAAEPNSEDRSCSSSGNQQYHLSNIFTFINSDQADWYLPTHEWDCPPEISRYTGNRTVMYKQHTGFLYNFDDYELSCITPVTYETDEIETTSAMRLPSKDDFVGEDKLNLFKKKGIRPLATEDMRMNKSGYGLGAEAYVEFWLRDPGNNGGSYSRVKIIDRTGSISSAPPSGGVGLRPVCTINPDTAVSEIESGIYKITPFEVTPGILWTDEELRNLLGI